MRESASVLALALRLRWADPQAPERYRVRAAGLRLATRGCLTVLAVTAAQRLVSTVLFAFTLPPEVGVTSPADLLFSTDPDGGTLLRDWSFLLWIPALILAVLGGRRLITWATVIGAIPAAVTVIGAIAHPQLAGFAAGTLALMVVQVAVIAGLAGMAGARADAVNHLRHRWVLAAAIGFLASQVPAVVGWLRLAPVPLPSVGYTLVDTAGTWCAAAVVAGIILIVRRSRGTRASTAALLGLAGLAGAATLLRASTLAFWVQYLHQGGPRSTPTLFSVVIQLGLATVITLIAGGLAAIRIHRMPAASYPTTGAPAPCSPSPGPRRS